MALDLMNLIETTAETVLLRFLIAQAASSERLTDLRFALNVRIIGI